MALLSAASAHADLAAMPLGALLSSEVISAPRFPREAPSAVSGISAREIGEHGCRSIEARLAWRF